ncbi:MAG: exosortase-associated EpsI family protein [Kiritimatiellae bacterium]|nr:exosortase-associated EpsI family protein [Kiritimatiellia bacterium]
MRTRSPVLTMVILVLMTITCFALLNFVDVTIVEESGIRMDLPPRLGEWSGVQLRYCHREGCRKDYRVDELPAGATTCPECGDALHNMTYEEWDQLPKDTEFIKAIYSHPAGGRVFASIVLQGRDRESIHRPERCLIGQGHRVDQFTTIDVPIGNEQPALRASILLTRREMNTPQGVVRGGENYYAFWFVGVNRETGNHWWRMFYLAWDRVVHSVAHKWAYIAVSGVREPGSKSYEDEIRAFIPLLREAIVRTPEEQSAPAPIQASR